MTSDKLSRFIVIFLLLPAFSLRCGAQGVNPEEKYNALYPGHNIITELKTRNVEIDFGRNDAPFIKATSQDILYVGTENSTSYSHSNEYFSPRAKMDYLKAYSLVPNEKGYKRIDVKNFTKTHDNSDNFFDDDYAYSFYFPAVGKGVKLVTESQVEFDDPTQPVFFYFGGFVPCDSSALTITARSNVELIYKLFGLDTSQVRFSRTVKGKNTIYTWYTSRMKPYTSEDNSPRISYYIPHIIVHIAGYTRDGVKVPVLGNTEDLFRWHYSYISNLDNTITPEIRQLVDSLTSGVQQDTEKVDRIYEWVQENIRYIAIEDGDNGLMPKDAKLVLSRRYGDCKDKSSLLKVMLTAAGFKANLGWIGSRERPYKYTDLPSMSCDDHMICIWWNDGNPVFLDGTAAHLNSGDVPAFIQGKQCMVEKGPDDFSILEVPVSKAAVNESVDSIYLKLDGETLLGDVVTSLKGEKRSDFLSIYDRIDSSKYTALIQNVSPYPSNKFKGYDVSVTRPAGHNDPAVLKYKFRLPSYTTSTSTTLYVNLNLERFYRDLVIKPGRVIPFEEDFCQEHRMVCTFEIPPGYRISQLPEPMSVSYPKFSYSATYVLNGNTLVFSSGMTLDFLLLSGSEIKQFREFLDQLNKSYSKSVALIKS